jgi:hypothetical protein
MSRDELKEAIWALPHSERLAMLVLSVLQDKSTNPAFSVFNLIKATSVIARYLNEKDRYRASEKMRDAADALESDRHCVVVE